MEQTAKIYIAGHTGMFGFCINRSTIKKMRITFAEIFSLNVNL